MIELTEETRRVLCAALLTAAHVEDKEINRCLKAYGKTVNGEKLEGLTARIDVSNARIHSYIDLYKQLQDCYFHLADSQLMIEDIDMFDP